MMRNQMVMDNINLVRYAIKTCHNRWSETDDLFQEGVEALIRAAQKFDSRKGTKFSTYAFRSITYAFNRMSRYDRVIKIPEHVPFDDENIIWDITSYELQEELGSKNLMKAIEGRNDMQGAVANKLALEGALEVLNKQERRYVQAKFFEDKTPKELLKEFGLSRQRLHQIEIRALKKMRDKLCVS